ncbi:RNA methyltransferase OB0768 [Picochlorum sp. SENEW3]|nr:RNA methyltransferase OB0768 [Picochlorum sp. SENEW3]
MSLRTASQLWLSGPKTRLPYSVNPRRCSSLVVKGKGLDVADGEARVLTCVDVSSQGSGVCKDKETGLVVFVPDSLPGEILRARIEKSGKQSFAHGVKLETLKSHDGSRMAYCNYAHECGGCSLQNLTYSPHQLDLKQSSVFNAFKRIGGVKSLGEKGIFRDIVGCDDEFHYRNKVEFSVDSHAKVIGKHVRGSADALVHISECVLQTNAANRLYRDICAVVLEEDAVISTVQHIVIRFSNAFQQCLVNIVTKDDARNNLSRLVEYVSERHADTLRGIVNSVSQDGALLEERKVETEHVLWGEGDLLEKLSCFTYRISPNSFFQTNTKQAERLYEYVVEQAQISSDDVVFDLYSGAGSMSLFLASNAKSVYGIEISESSVADARYNAALNGVDNVEFVQGDVGHISQLTHGRQPDIVVVDPARAGLSKRAIKGLLKCMPKKLVYVSCNAATQARDVREFLNNGYWLESVRPFDLFPQTMHVECVAVLHRKDA